MNNQMYVTPDTSAATPMTVPSVWLWRDQAPITPCRMRSMDRHYPLDERAATFAIPDADANVVTDMLDGRQGYSLVMPVSLNTRESRHIQLIHGQLISNSDHEHAGEKQQIWTITDSWTQHLDESIPIVASEDASGCCMIDRPGIIRAGKAGNRSTARYAIANDQVYLPRVDEPGGQQWSVGQAFETLSSLGRLDLNLAPLPTDIRLMPLPIDLDTSLPVRRILQALCEAVGCHVQRSAEADVGWPATGRPTICPASTPLGWVDAELCVDRRIDHAVAAARRVVVRGQPPEVEVTVALLPGWDPSLESQADSYYDKLLSPDFASYGQVFRYWVLNEDGRFAAAPFNQPVPITATDLFPDQHLPLQPLVLRPCLTLDGAGSPLPILIEYRLDDQSGWEPYSGQSEILSGRVGVEFQEQTLDASWLAAARAGTLQVRATGRIVSPRRLTSVRWVGNPLAGVDESPERPLETDHAWRRVDSSSRYADRVADGELDARVADDRPQLHQQALIMTRSAQTNVQHAVTLPGMWWHIAPGQALLGWHDDPTRKGRVVRLRIRQTARGVTTQMQINDQIGVADA